MLKSCKYCMRIHDTKYDCGKKPKKIQQRTEHDAFRNTAEWQRTREKIKERDNYLCQICIRGLYGTIRQANCRKLSVHHAEKLEYSYEKRTDENNLITLCEQHHKMCDSGEIPMHAVKRIIQEQNADKDV